MLLFGVGQLSPGSEPESTGLSRSSAWRRNPTSPRASASPPPGKPSIVLISPAEAVLLSLADPRLPRSCHRDSKPCPASLLWSVMGSDEVQALRTFCMNALETFVSGFVGGHSDPRLLASQSGKVGRLARSSQAMDYTGLALELRALTGWLH